MANNLEKPEGKYTAHCIKCLSQSSLLLIPHREDGKMVGWVFGCQGCAEKIYGADMVFTYPEDFKIPLERCKSCKMCQATNKDGLCDSCR